MADGEEVAGTIEYYDQSFIRLPVTAPNLFIFKHDIKYIQEEASPPPMHYLETAAISPAAPARFSPTSSAASLRAEGEFDLVTEADRASERLVVERLRSHFPGHRIVAEEGGGHDCSSEFRWFVDPLDGTTNFAHGFPVFNVTLGLERAGEMVAGVIYDPIRQEMFTAERSRAYLNNRRQSSTNKALR
jgi:myo-inositol-1(or 4)-monophosphatase